MRSGGWFGEMAKSLRDGLFADRVILALAKAQRNGGPIPEERKALFAKTSEFLSDAISGYQWMDKPTFSSTSANHASLFGQAVRAMEIASAPADFIAYLTELKATADELAAGGTIGTDRLTKLRDFFVNHSTAEMRRSDEMSDMWRKRGEMGWGILSR